MSGVVSRVLGGGGRRGYTTVGPAAQIAADMARQQLQCGCGEVVPLVRLRAHQLECEAERADLAAAASAATASAASAAVGRSAPAAAANHHTFACPYTTAAVTSLRLSLSAAQYLRYR